MRSIRAVIFSALLAFGLATASWAQNGLERFEKELKPQFELKQLTYQNAEPLGDSGFILNDVVAVVPAGPATGDKDTTVRIQKVTVEALDFDHLKKDDDAPRFARLELEGMTGDDEVLTALQPYGVPNVPLDIALDYRLDHEKKVLDLKRLEITLRGQARIALSLVLDDIGDVADAKDNARLRAASLTLDDSGLLARLVPGISQEQGAKPDDMIQTARTAIAGFSESQGPDTLKALDAIASFVADWKAPKGPLVLELKPGKTAGLDDIAKIMIPDALSTEFGFTASYAGTQAGAAKGGTTAAK